MVSEVPDVRPPTQDGGQGGDDLILDLHPHKVHLNQQQDVTYIQSSDCSSDSDENEPSMGYDNALAVNPSGNDNNTPNVFVSDSSDVHVGTKNIYQGPVTIKKIVYAGNGGGEVPDVLQNGGALTNGTLKCDKDTSDSTDIDNKTDKAGDKNENNLKAHISKLRYNKPLLITAIVCTLAIIGMIALLFLLLRGGNTSNRYPTDSDEQLGRPSVDPPLETPLPYNLVTRTDWVAQPPAKPAPQLKQPTPFVIIHQSDTLNCTTIGDCIFFVRYLQTYHIDSKQMWDISYNFLVGGDGNVYDGRGWTSEGAHTFNYNSRSIGIALIGTFEDYLPGKEQLDTLMKLINYGVEAKYLQANYKLIGARQVDAVRNPGRALYEEIKTWPHWVNNPAELPPQRVKMILRREWLAQPPKQALDNLTTPVPMVVIWHSATENCTDQSSCTLLVKSIQRFHMLSQNWWDIGYNFLVGGDGYVYEGRGWTSEGSHTKFYNKRSIGIAFVGTFTNYMPPQRQLNAARNLIALGVNESYIQPDYKLYASRQLSVTESPGQMLYEELITWPHWAETPKSGH